MPDGVSMRLDRVSPMLDSVPLVLRRCPGGVRLCFDDPRRCFSNARTCSDNARLNFHNLGHYSGDAGRPFAGVRPCFEDARPIPACVIWRLCGSGRGAPHSNRSSGRQSAHYSGEGEV